MNLLYEITPLLGFILSIVLIPLVLRHHWHSRVHRVFAFFLFNMGLWAFTVYGMRLSPTLEQAFIWEKVTLVILPLVSVSFYHFVFLFTKRKGALWQLIAAYISVPLFAALLPGDWLISGMRTMWYGYGFVAGPLLSFYLVSYYGLVLVALSFLVDAYRKAGSALEKKGYLYIAIGIVICLLGVVTDYMATKGVPIFPVGILSNILFFSLSTYAILRFQLLDISLVVRKGTTYMLVYALGTTIYVGLVFATYAFVTRTWSMLDWIHIAFLLLVTIGLQPALRRAQHLVDRWFYRDRYDYLMALENFSAQTRDITELAFIADMLLYTITAAMRCRRALVLLPDAENNFFEVVASRGVAQTSSIRLYRQSALIAWLGKQGKPVTRGDIQVMPQLQALTAREKEMVNNLDAELFIPLMTRVGLRGVLVLGPNLSGDAYSPADIRLLKIVAHQMSTTIDNARLYDLQRRRYQEQVLLARLALIVSSELELKKMCDLFLAELAKALPVDYATIILMDQEKKVPATAFSWSKVADSSSRPDTVVSPDSETGPERPVAEIDGEQFNSMLRLPLHSENKALGDFVLASREPDAYDEDRTRLLQQAAVQLAIGIDRAQLYHLERETREELERQYNEKTDFINALIHEVKTPMTAIITSSELLKEELASSPTLGPLADNLDVAAHSLDHRVTELVDFVKLQKPEIKFNKRLVDLRPVAEKAAHQLTGLFRSRNQKLELDFPSRLGRVRADPERLTQVLLNLLTNASNFSGTDNAITLRGYVANGSVVVEVHDSAPPIKPEEAKLLFHRYYRGSHKGTGGLGLGLFICKKLVELHGGKIWVETDGDGNRFKFALPLATRQEVKYESPAR